MSRVAIQIVPLWSSAAEGVGDYARLLAQQLANAHDLRSIFIATTPLPATARRADQWKSHELARCDAAALLAALATVERHAPILLHLSAYGYHRRGVPFWLASALERWRCLNPAVPLVTIYHELSATGPIWRSAFWLGPLQARIARRLRRISTDGVATTAAYAAQVNRWPAKRSHPIIPLPVFSTIGETDPSTPVASRKRSLAVFARASAARTLYCDRLPDIARIVSQYGIQEILDLGHRTEAPPASIGNAAVRQFGELPADGIRAVLADARLGLVDYDADRLAKSTIFAAYCANGVIPLCLSDKTGASDGLQPGQNYVKLPAIPVPETALPLQEMQCNALDWYRAHTLCNSAAVIARLLHHTPEHH